MKMSAWNEVRIAQEKIDERAEEIERDLDDLENDRREMNDVMYRRLRKNLLARRRRNDARQTELNARVGL